MLDNVIVLSPTTSEELHDVVYALRKDLMNHREIQLLIVDSLSLLIHYSSDPLHRTKSYFYILKLLREISLMHITVIITNEMMNQRDNQGKDFSLVSAGGQITAHRMHKRLLLTRIKETQFAAHILKSSLLPQISINFKITRNGIEDC